MMYKVEHDYRFDAGKLEAAYGLALIPYREGIVATLAEGAELVRHS